MEEPIFSAVKKGDSHYQSDCHLNKRKILNQDGARSVKESQIKNLRIILELI
jgi:hypothetical protein